MELNTIRDVLAWTTSKRVGRGIGSGKGKTCGRGYKGQKSRTGVALKGFEGGQSPLHRRLPKRGFVPPRSVRLGELTVQRLATLCEAGFFTAGQSVTLDVLREKGVVGRSLEGVRVIGLGTLPFSLTVDVAGVSVGARAAIEKAGGKVL